jgi:glutathione S-transferase
VRSSAGLRCSGQDSFVPSDVAAVDRIYHLALEDEWRAAERAGDYRRSTLEESLDDVGFIHCSFATQVQQTADRFYRGRRDVVLLTIDTSRLQAEVEVENLFPHIYGPLPVDAVIRVDAVPVDADGRLATEALTK